MSTTTLYAELLVVGTGPVIFLILLFSSLLGKSEWISEQGGLLTLGNLFSLIPVISAIYLLGIVFNNVSFLLFKGIEEKLRKKKSQAPMNINGSETISIVHPIPKK